MANNKNFNLEVAQIVKATSHFGYVAELWRYSSRSRLVQPEKFDMRHTNMTTLFVDENFKEYWVNSLMSLNFRTVLDWFGMTTTKNSQANLTNFWSYANANLKDFEIYALVYDKSQPECSDERLISVSVSENVEDYLNEHNKVIGYIFPNEVNLAIYREFSLEEYSYSTKLESKKGSVKKAVKCVTEFTRRYIDIEYAKIRVILPGYRGSYETVFSIDCAKTINFKSLVRILKLNLVYYTCGFSASSFRK